MYDEKELEVFRSDSGLERYRMPLRFTALNKYRVITSDMPLFVVHKAAHQLGRWVSQWEYRTDLRKRRLGLEMNAKRDDLKPSQKRKIADSRTALAQEDITPLRTVLASALSREPSFNWDMLKTIPEYPFPAPEAPQWPAKPAMPALPREPQRTDEAYLPQLDAMDKVVKSRREEKERAAMVKYEAAHRQWGEICQRINQVHQEQLRQWGHAVKVLKDRHDQETHLWSLGHQKFMLEREQCKPLVEAKRQAYMIGDPYSVLDYCDMLLAWSPYPDFLPQAFDLDYFPEQKGLLVEYLLPPLRVLPRLNTVEYNEATDSFRETLLTDEQRTVMYADLLNEIPLRSLYELFTGDKAGAIQMIRFDGYIFLDEQPNSGAPPSCVLTIETGRDAFMSLDLAHTPPAESFEQIGGIFHSGE